ncbi:phosphotransferase family protein [Salinisphaera sp. RV14]|uniref:phosphotransferase family protein n=1 Tax=unclassified Salinisphaera TaxID=2649847 RepID=UPI003F86B61A
MSEQEAGEPALVDIRSAHRFDTGALERYLEREGLLTGALSVKQFQGGQSNPTFLLQIGEGERGARYVLRKQPPGRILPSAHRVDREYRVMDALANVPDVPVPAMRSYCDDAAVIGTPFYVMDYVEGRVFNNQPTLADVARDQRAGVYHRMIDTLAALHSVDVAAVGLSDFGKPEGYVERQVALWRKQYDQSTDEPDPAMIALGDWLAEHLPPDSPPTIAHGDFRIGNLLLAPDLSAVRAVLDWELATLGHPLADLAYACLPYYLPPGQAGLPGLVGLDLAEHGIPDEAELLARYRARRNLAQIDDWPVFIAFSLFRIAAILQGVYARAVQGNASNANALEVGRQAGRLAERGWEIARSHD